MRVSTTKGIAMKRYGVFVWTMLSLALPGCAVEPPAPAPVPASEIELRGPTSGAEPSATPQIRFCECDVTCTATGDGFAGTSTINAALACSQARAACRATGCTTCVIDASGC